MSIHRRFSWALMAGFLALWGCVAEKPNPQIQDPIEIPPATYLGLPGQSVAIMVWADSTTRAEYNRIQIDLATALQNRLQPPVSDKDKEKKKSDVPPMQFVAPASVVRFQKSHPETDGLPIVEVAPRLGAARVIYIELENFQTASPQSIMILKGEAEATLRVVEVTGGTAKVVLEERGIKALFPPHSPEGVVPSDKVTVRTIYEGTVLRLADKLNIRFKKSEE